MEVHERVAMPHPKRRELIDVYSRRIMLHLERGNLDAVREITETAVAEIDGYSVSLADPVAVLGVDDRLLNWLGRHRIHTVRDLLELPPDVAKARRFEKRWWPQIQKTRQMLAEMGFTDCGIRG
jgi:hypothetical protein